MGLATAAQFHAGVETWRARLRRLGLHQVRLWDRARSTVSLVTDDSMKMFRKASSSSHPFVHQRTGTGCVHLSDGTSLLADA
jgi:hypothetical protein